MNKIILLALTFFLPVVIFSQEIKSNEVDPFTNERTIETTLVSIKQGLSVGFGISYLAVNANYYLNVIGYGNDENSIKKDDRLWFVLNDGNVVQFNQIAEAQNALPAEKNVYMRHYFANLNDIETLKNKHVAILRISSANNSIIDFPISKKVGKAILKLNDLFFKEVNKAATTGQ